MRHLSLVAAAVAVVALSAYGFTLASGGSRQAVERDKLMISTVEEAAFREFFSVSGAVMPRTTVYLDAVEGGRIEEVYVEEGTDVSQGQPVLRLSNSNLQLQVVQAEAQRIEQDNLLQNLRFQMEQNAVNRRQQLAETEYEILRLERLHQRQKQLHEKQLISDEQFEETQHQLEYWRGRRDLTLRGYRQDSLRQVTEISRMQMAVGRMQKNFEVVEQSLENLTVRAPVSGQLSMLDAEVGEIRPQGSRFGQIDVLDGGYLVRATVDEFYISRIARGQTASTQSIGGREYSMTVARVYPEVRSGRFEIDLVFAEGQPADLRRGQTIRLRLELGDATETVVVPRGGFYQTTGGSWIYVVHPSGAYAEKRPIRLGRQNPSFYEVLDGLQPGGRVVTSGYESFGDVDRLVLK